MVTDGGGWGGITLAYNTRSPEEVDAVLAEAEAAGGTIGRPGAATEWGGYSGIFFDPDGHAWEVAHNPDWTITDDGATSWRLTNVPSEIRGPGRSCRAGAGRAGRGARRPPRPAGRSVGRAAGAAAVGDGRQDLVEQRRPAGRVSASPRRPSRRRRRVRLLSSTWLAGSVGIVAGGEPDHERAGRRRPSARSAGSVCGPPTGSMTTSTPPPRELPGPAFRSSVS